MQDFSYANLANLKAIDALYQSYLQNPESVDPSWRHFFEGMTFAQTLSAQGGGESPDLRIHLLIEAYRKFGHLFAQCNPIATQLLQEPKEIQLSSLHFKEEERSNLFPTCGLLPEKMAPLEKIILTLRRTYCAHVGIECTGLESLELQKWIQEQIEPNFPLHLEREELIALFRHLTKAEVFETFLHTKFVGQKRFSLEGCETMIPMLSAMIEHGAILGIEEVVIGMAHRGRLNVLANILNKSYRLIFNEFEDHYVPPQEFEGTGDVKYHKGFEGKLQTAGGRLIPVTLAANPSHLETVDPVVEGIVRAKQELRGKREGKAQVIPLLIHGDASISGQGVVYETLQLSGLNGYSTGGTVHLVVNNQIGFTTLPKDGRSTRYCSEIGRAFGCPVFHVNAEDVKSCVRVAHLAVEIRQKFQCDVIIDLVCYRKYGHNEGDEPTFTQPLEYEVIKSKASIRTLFRNELIAQGVLSEEEASSLESQFKADLQKEMETKPTSVVNQGSQSQEEEPPLTSAVPEEQLRRLSELLCTVPGDLRIHPKVQRLLKERLQMSLGAQELDWGFAETLAYATLLMEKIHVRISGQDVRRGTFSHRHAILVDQVTGQRYFPLSHLSSDQAPFDIFNSPLSEYAVLGFDFGYSLSYQPSLVVWEAQFGDFVNGAQIVIDQYLSSSEQKWGVRSNLTLLLPHGHEGQGPEHTSGRMERFLQLCAQDNLRVCNCSTPAQLFHLLRLQAHTKKRRPLILFTPKALLRHPSCLSPLNRLTSGQFEEVIDDPEPIRNARRVLLCSGKVFYELLEERKKRNCSDIALVRIEQLYPFPKEKIGAILSKYGAKELFWVQEEHRNMGAWEFIHPQLNALLNLEEKVHYIGRTPSAAPAVGSHALHHAQLEEFLHNAFSEKNP
jgi:2-oxoglutarate dehydrogenase E1 component